MFGKGSTEITDAKSPTIHRQQTCKQRTWGLLVLRFVGFNDFKKYVQAGKQPPTRDQNKTIYTPENLRDNN